VLAIANTSSFNGQNWLSTDIPDIYDIDNNGDTVASSFTRDASGNVAVNSAAFHLSATSLFNSTGGGLLQKDVRNINTIGGMRWLATYITAGEETHTWIPETAGTINARFEFDFTGPMTFDDPTDEISFDVLVDKDNPSDGIDPPYNPGRTTSVTINRSTIDAVNPAWNGVISNFEAYQQVLNYALTQANTGAYASLVSDGHGGVVPDLISVGTSEDRSTGMNGSYIEVSNFTANGVSGAGLTNNSDQGVRGSKLTIDFTPFQDFRDGDLKDGVSVSFNFAVNDEPPKSYSFDRTYVNTVLGVENGKVETADQMVTLLQSLLSADWPTLQIESLSPSSVTLKTDPALDRRAGSDTAIRFSNILVSNEPLPEINFMDIDIEAHPDSVDDYINYIETASQRITAGASQLGSLQKRLEMQSNFTSQMLDNIDAGVGRLVDTDMEQASAKLNAEQTQQQLAIQALQIANTSAQSIMQLFNR
jgi:flagellin